MEGGIDIRIQDGPGSAEQHPTTQTKSRDEWIQKYVERYQFPPHPTDFPLRLNDHLPGRWVPEDRGHWAKCVAADSSAMSRSEYAILFTAYSRHDSYALAFSQLRARCLAIVDKACIWRPVPSGEAFVPSSLNYPEEKCILPNQMEPALFEASVHKNSRFAPCHTRAHMS